jgi:hypothetical protein
MVGTGVVPEAGRSREIVESEDKAYLAYCAALWTAQSHFSEHCYVGAHFPQVLRASGLCVFQRVG